MTLISRLEAATGPDRGLDALIAAHTGWDGWTVEEWEPFTRGEPGKDWAPEHPPVMVRCPEFTKSLDAAMTLVRPEDDIDSYKLLCDCGCWFVSFRSVIGFNGEVETFTEGGTENVALEFCTQYFRHIAALKARGIGSGE